jgi:hypothetical protein
MLLFAARAAMQVAEQGAAHRLCSCTALHVSVRRTERETPHAQNAAVTLGDCRQPVPAVLPSSEAVDARLPRVYRPHSSSHRLSACMLVVSLSHVLPFALRVLAAMFFLKKKAMFL